MPKAKAATDIRYFFKPITTKVDEVTPEEHQGDEGVEAGSRKAKSHATPPKKEKNSLIGGDKKTTKATNKKKYLVTPEKPTAKDGASTKKGRGRALKPESMEDNAEASKKKPSNRLITQEEGSPPSRRLKRGRMDEINGSTKGEIHSVISPSSRSSGASCENLSIPLKSHDAPPVASQSSEPKRKRRLLRRKLDMDDESSDEISSATNGTSSPGEEELNDLEMMDTDSDGSPNYTKKPKTINSFFTKSANVPKIKHEKIKKDSTEDSKIPIDLDGFFASTDVKRVKTHEDHSDTENMSPRRLSNQKAKDNLTSDEKKSSYSNKGKKSKKPAHHKNETALRKAMDTGSIDSSDSDFDTKDHPISRSKKKNQQLTPKKFNKKKSQNEDVKSIEPAKRQSISAIANEENINELNPFFQKKFVFTGEFERMNREEVSDLVKIHGGYVTTAVSTKTDYLVYGNQLEDGRDVSQGRKYTKAQELIALSNGHIKLINEEEFFQNFANYKNEEINRTSFAFPHESIKEAESEKKKSYSLVHPDKQENLKTDLKTNEPSSNLNDLWVEKYRPQRVEDLVGNKEVVRKLMSWLQDWHDVCILGHKKTVEKPKFYRGGFFDGSSNVNARAVLISGPPGIGKTTAARLMARICGFEVLEFNSSDQRNKSSIEDVSQMATGGQVITSSFQMKDSKICLIMDEMDGLSAGDRGGSQALIKLIGKTMCPIICICNDRMHPKVRSLASKCYELKFQRPHKASIVKRAMDICNLEEIQADENALELLCESVGNDFRLLLNTIQFMTKNNQTQGLDYMRMKNEVKYGMKDAQVVSGPFDIAKQLLDSSTASHMNINERLDGFFTDYDLMPLLMQDNYLSAMQIGFEKAKSLDITKMIENMANAANDFVQADLLSTILRTKSDWSLLPDVGLMTCVIPAYRNKLAQGWIPRVSFPSWFGKNSTTSKNRRLLSEIIVFLGDKTSSNSSLQYSGYIDLVYQKCMNPLLNNKNPKEAAEMCLRIIDDLGITKNLLVENIASLRLKNQESLYEKVESKVKSSLTRLSNSSASISSNFLAARKARKINSVEKTFNETDDLEESHMKENSSDNGENEANEDNEFGMIIQTTTPKKTLLKSKPMRKNKSGK